MDIMNKYFNRHSMNLYELILNRLFFSADYLKNRTISRELKAIEKFYSSNHKDKNQRIRINDFLNEVNNNVPYYDKFSNIDLENYPVITKKEISNSYNDFLSKKYQKEKLVSVSTSGSYGTPMTFYRSNEKRIRQTAEVLYFGKEIDYYIGRNHAFIRGISKSKLKLFLQNEIHIDPTHLDEESVKVIIQKLKRAKFIIGFPSVILSIIKTCESMKISPKDFNILGIISTSEPLFAEQRLKIKHYFNCPIVARYATEELGIIANQCVHTESYHINEASFVVEILKKDSDEKAADGEEGRIVVTDLYSNAMPLIRYETGDLGTMTKGCSCGYDGKVLKTISGRKIESILDENNNEVSPFSINVKMKDYKNIYQFQFIQEDYNRYKLLLIVSEEFEGEKVILSGLKKILGKNANIQMELVESIPPLPSGKRPYIINKLNNR